jgi:hypothetical protein
MKKISLGIILFLVALILVLPVNAVYVACTNGSAATIAVNWTFTGAPGTLALVSNVGTTSNALLDFTIPEGQPGALGGDSTQFLFINGSRAMTGNLNLNTKQITNLVSGTTGTSAVNKSYVDSVSGGSPPDLTPFIFINGTRAYTGSQSMGGFQITNLVTGTLGTNAANKSYVDSAVSGIGTPDLTPFLFINGTRAMSGNLNMSNSQILKLVTGSTGDSAVNKTYVDSGLPYVLTTNATLVLTGNNTYILTGGSRAFTADQSMGGFSLTNVNTGLNAGNAVNKSYVDSGLPYVLNTNTSLLLTTNASVATTTYVASVNTSMKNYVDSRAAPDLTPFVFINGTRAFTGDISHGGFKITSLVTGLTGDSAVNKTYVDAGLPYVLASNSSLILSGNTSFVAATNSSLLLNTNTSVATTTIVSSTNTSMKNYVDNAIAGVQQGDTSQFLFINGTRAMTGNLQLGNQQITGLVTGSAGTTAVNRSYVDSGLPYVLASNSSLILAGNTSYVSSTNSSLALVTNASIASTSYVGSVNTSMKNYVDSAISGVGSPDLSPFLFINGTRAMTGDLNMGSKQISGVITGATGGYAVNRSYVDSGLPYVLATNSSLLLNTNASVATTTYVGSVNTSMKSYVDTAISGVSAPDLTPFLFINGTRSMTGNLSMNSKYINGVITGNLGTDAVNRSYVDAGGLPYVAASNASLLLTTNNSIATTTYVSTAINAVDHSAYLFLNGTRTMTGNLTMGGKSITGVVTGVGADAVNKSYVDAAIAAVGGSPPDLTPFLFTNGTRAMSGNLQMGNQQITGLVTGSGTSAVNRTYVDSGLPYVLASNSSLILAGNTSFVASTNSSLLLNTNTSVATTTLVSSTNTSMKNYVDIAVSGVGSPDLTPFLFINGTRAMTGNLSMNSKYINGVITGNVGTDAVNRSYVDSGGLPYVATSNTSLLLTTNTSVATTTFVNTAINAVDHSMYLFLNGTRVMSGNLQMGNQQITGLVTGSAGTTAVNRSYVDSGLPYVLASNSSLILAGNTSFVAANNASLLLTTNTSVATTTLVGNTNTSMKNYVDIAVSDVGSPDLTPFLFINGTRAMTGNLSMNSKYINNVVTGSLGTDAVNRSYIDVGLPYVASNNASLLLTTNASVATTTYVSSVNTSMKNYVDAAVGGVGSPDLTPFLFINGTRAMTGNLSMGSKWVNNVVTGALGTDAVNRSYVDAGLPYVTASNTSIITAGNTSFVAATNSSLVLVGNTSYILANGGRAFTADQSHGNFKITNLVTGTTGDTATNKTYVDTAVSGVGTPDLTPFLFINGTRAMTGNLSAGSFYINSLVSGAPGSSAVNKSYVDLTNSTLKTYVDSGLPYVASSNQSIILSGNASFVATTNSSLVLLGNTSYILTNGQRAMAANLSMGSYYINSLITGAAGTTAVNRSYVDSGLPYVASSNTSIITAGNTSFVASTNSSLLLTTNTSVIDNPVTSYITLMAGSAMIPTTNPVGMDQIETSTNKNNYIFVNFTDGGSENAQWVVDMPYDWNSTDATNGKLTFNFLWTASAGSGTVNFTMSGRLFPDDAPIDTALAQIGTATDTLLTAGDMHVSPDTTAAVVPSAGTGGKTIIFKVTRDSTTDTLNSNAKLLGVRVKYIRTLA